MSDYKVREECGIFGAFNDPEAARHTYYGLHALQHRGQESSGIVTSTYDEQKKQPVMPSHKDFGLVLDVFDDPSIFEQKLLGDAAIGHNRYSTSGSAANRSNIQPFVVHHRNGNLAGPALLAGHVRRRGFPLEVRPLLRLDDVVVALGLGGDELGGAFLVAVGGRSTGRTDHLVVTGVHHRPTVVAELHTDGVAGRPTKVARRRGRDSTVRRTDQSNETASSSSTTGQFRTRNRSVSTASTIVVPS